MGHTPIPATLLGVFLVGFLGSGHASEARRVNASHADLHAGPSDDAFVVMSVPRGTALKAISTTGDGWVEVEAPQSADLWIYRDLVRDGAVIAPTVLVRSGPGIAYASVGQVQRGDRLTVRGRQGEWLKIAPPAGCKLYAGASALGVEAAPPQVPAKPTPPKAPDTSRPVVSQRPEVSLAEPPSLKPAPMMVAPSAAQLPRGDARGSAGVAPRRQIRRPQAKAEVVDSAPPLSRIGLPSGATIVREVRFSGIVRPVGGPVWRRPSQYRLVELDVHERPVTVCYLVGDARMIEEHLSVSVQVQGRLYSVTGVRHPVLQASSITPLHRR